MTNQDFVTLATLAQDLGMDRSATRRYVLKNRYCPVRIRTAESRGQLMLALPSEDAEAVRALRRDQGFGAQSSPQDSGVYGAFYAIQVIPEFDPGRVKLGFASDSATRLMIHRTSAPTAVLIKSWPCLRVWEPCAIASITRVECAAISAEVFKCDDVLRLVARADAFFALMPGA